MSHSWLAKKSKHSLLNEVNQLNREFEAIVPPSNFRILHMERRHEKMAKTNATKSCSWQDVLLDPGGL
ncbi:hypothetical protein ANCCEY_06363 [Ancylostoma ceylanicum]|uniref:Uncharacterized protein n=1 Tax=Ancylostoma ceylanicum TaxID=53326 RepID=A0A0D6LWS2_9BILA|nr:hypothetical protein ANCCEY_06363 [Ancylostoma ceylanicum]